MAVIFTASTEKGSQKHTEAMVRPPVQFISPTITEPQFQKVHFDVRKAAHFIEYAILAALLLRAVRAQPGLAKLSLFVQIPMAILISAAYAGTDEWHQHFVHSRTANFKDVLIDTSGAAFGALVFYFSMRFLSKSRVWQCVRARKPFSNIIKFVQGC